MKHSRLWLSASIIALIIIVSFVISVPHTRDLEETKLSSAPAASVPPVALEDSYKNGLHTISGSLQAPDACAIATAEAVYQGDASSTESILVAIVLPEDDSVCLQVPTRVEFETTVEAPADIPITATVNGVAATTTVS